MKYQLNHPVAPESHVGALQVLLAVFVLSTISFGLLAVRNARMLSCDDITYDRFNNVRVCEISLNPDGSIKQ